MRLAVKAKMVGNFANMSEYYRAEVKTQQK